MRHLRDRYRQGLWILCIFAGCVALTLILAGCSDDGAILDNNTYSGDNVSFFDQPYYPDAVAKRSDILVSESWEVKSRFTVSSGGVMALGEDVDIESFVVLPFSFVADTTFTITVTRLVTEDGEMPIIYDFGPDGLQFSRPAVLRLNVAELFGKNVSEVEFYWLNEETGEWVPDESLAPDSAGNVYKSVPHFSTGAGAPKKDTVNPGTDTQK